MGVDREDRGDKDRGRGRRGSSGEDSGDRDRQGQWWGDRRDIGDRVA